MNTPSGIFPGLLRLIGLLALVVAPAFASSSDPSVTLAGEKLYLGYVEGAGGDVVLNEYIRRDETFDNWKVLFGVRAVKSAKTVDSVVERWKAYLSQVNSPGITIEERKGSSPKDRRFSVSIRAPGDAYVENDEMRFVPGPGGQGVVYYQAAVRFSPKDEAGMKRAKEIQAAFAKALGSVDVKVVETK